MTLSQGVILKNRYKIERLLAQGGMGAIYKGFDTNLNMPVAIKENFFYTPQNIRQFKQEAQILARLHHPGLPRVIQHFSVDNQQYLVMDFIDGQDLWEMVQQQGQPLEESQALNYILQVCDAVSYLHRQKPPIIHRDIKPQNIKVTPDGQAVLVDFGIAKVAEAGSQTSTGARGVTPGFSPPEQYSEEGTTPVSDVFSLGATLYAVLTGKKPPNSISLLVSKDKFKAPAELNTKLTQRVSQAILHAMQPQTKNRPQSVAAWQRELEAIFEAPTVPVDPVDEEPTMVGKAVPLWLLGPAGQSFQLQEGAQTVGRGSTCDIQIKDQLASRLNTRLQVSGQSCTVYDEGSANGTFVNQLPVSGRGYALRIGDKLRIGDTVLTLSLTSVASRPQPAIIPPPHVDELAGTAFAPLSGAVAQPAPASVPVAPVTAPPTESSKTPVILLSVGMLIALLLAAGIVLFLVIQTGNRTPTPDPKDIIAAAVAATQQAEAGVTPSVNAQATLEVLSATATAQAQIEPAPPVDTEATISAAVAATEQAKADAVQPTEVAADTLPSATSSPTPQPTATPLPSPTGTFTPAPTLKPTSTPVLAAPLGVFQDFESQTPWRRGDEPNGEFYYASGQVHDGNLAGQLDYRFPTSGNDYVVFLQNRQLAGRPNAISAWVYGDGKGHFLNLWLKDAAGETWQMSFGQIKHTGWQEMTAKIDPGQPWPSQHVDGPNNGTVDYPISFMGLVLDDGADTFSGQGTIYIDSLTSREGATVAGPTNTPTPVPAQKPTAVPTPVVSKDYVLAVAGQHLYETWGAPKTSDLCEAYRNGDFDDKNHKKGFNIEFSLTNKSTQPVADDWSPSFTTAAGQDVQVCYYGYKGSGPQPGATTYMTFFTIVEPTDYVRVVQLEINGQTLQICLDPSGAQGPC